MLYLDFFGCHGAVRVWGARPSAGPEAGSVPALESNFWKFLGNKGTGSFWLRLAQNSSTCEPTTLRGKIKGTGPTKSVVRLCISLLIPLRISGLVC